MGSVSRGELEGQHRGPGEELQTAGRRHGRRGPVDRACLGSRQANCARGCAREGTGATQDGSPASVRAGGQVYRQQLACSSRRCRAAGHLGLPRGGAGIDRCEGRQEVVAVTLCVTSPAHHAERDGYIQKAAGEALPPSKPLTGPAPPRRSVCAPGTMSLPCFADRKESFMLRHISATRIALAFAVLGLAGPLAAGEQVPFKGSLEGTVTRSLPPPPIFVLVEGEGTATQLGQFTVDIPHMVVPPNGSGFYHFVAANGDTLTAEFTGVSVLVAPGFLYIEETATITGGTGRFAAATGSFFVERLYDMVAGTTVGSFEGTISTPGS